MKAADIKVGRYYAIGTPNEHTCKKAKVLDVGKFNRYGDGNDLHAKYRAIADAYEKRAGARSWWDRIEVPSSKRATYVAIDKGSRKGHVTFVVVGHVRSTWTEYERVKAEEEKRADDLHRLYEKESRQRRLKWKHVEKALPVKLGDIRGWENEVTEDKHIKLELDEALALVSAFLQLKAQLDNRVK